MEKIKKYLYVTLILFMCLILVYLIIFNSIIVILQNIFIAFLMIPITYLIIKYIFESKRMDRWNKISNHVLNKLNRELSGLFIDLTNICGFNRVISGEFSDNEMFKRIDRNLINELDEHVKNKDIKIDEMNRRHIINGRYGKLFKNREEYLNQFELKYLEYLEAEIIISISEIQDALHYINQDIIIRNKQIKNKWLRLDNDNQLGKRLEKHFQQIADNLKKLKDRNYFKYK